MRRNCNKVLAEWRVEKNPDEDVNKGKCWKFNKNVSDEEKRKFRGETYKKNVSMVVD